MAVHRGQAEDRLLGRSSGQGAATAAANTPLR